MWREPKYRDCVCVLNICEREKEEEEEEREDGK